MANTTTKNDDKGSDVMDWAGTVARSHTGQRCQTCTQRPDAAGKIREYMELRIAGKVPHGITMFHQRFLLPKLNYPYSETSLRRHMMRCESDLWAQL